MQKPKPKIIEERTEMSKAAGHRQGMFLAESLIYWWNTESSWMRWSMF